MLSFTLWCFLTYLSHLRHNHYYLCHYLGITNKRLMIACDGVRNSQTHFLEVSLVESLVSSVCFLYVNHMRQNPFVVYQRNSTIFIVECKVYAIMLHVSDLVKGCKFQGFFWVWKEYQTNFNCHNHALSLCTQSLLLRF